MTTKNAKTEDATESNAKLNAMRDALIRIASSPVASNGMHDGSGETVADVAKKALGLA